MNILGTNGQSAGIGKTLTVEWKWGQHIQIDFEQSTDILDFEWIRPSQFEVNEVNGSTMVSIPSNNQSYTLVGVTLADLNSSNFRANDLATMKSLSAKFEDNAAETPIPSQTTVLEPGANTPNQMEVGTGEKPTPTTLDSSNHGQSQSGLLIPQTTAGVESSTPKTVTLEWNYGIDRVIDFYPATDKLDLDWFQPDQISVMERDGSVVISIPLNNQTYTLKGTTLSDLNVNNVSANDKNMQTELSEILNGGDIGSGAPTTVIEPQPASLNDQHSGSNDPTLPVNPSSHTPDADGNGNVYNVSAGGSSIENFNPATDKMDFGQYTAHGVIIVDTAAGVGFRNPWNGQTQYLNGVKLQDLSVDNFTKIGNLHLRLDVSSALAWEKGVTPKPDTVYYRTHEAGQVDKVKFNPETDKVSFIYAASREQYSLKDGPEGVVISNAGTGQKLILEDVKKSELSASNFQFHFTQVREDHLDNQVGFTVSGDQIVSRDFMPTAGENNASSGVGQTQSAGMQQGNAMSHSSKPAESDEEAISQTPNAELGFANDVMDDLMNSMFNQRPSIDDFDALGTS